MSSVVLIAPKDRANYNSIRETNTHVQEKVHNLWCSRVVLGAGLTLSVCGIISAFTDANKITAISLTTFGVILTVFASCLICAEKNSTNC